MICVILASVTLSAERSSLIKCDQHPPLLRAQNLHRMLGSGDATTHILKSIDLTIDRGEYVSIVGASGSGKSTLLYLLGGLDRADLTDETGKLFTPESAVFIDGLNTHELTETQLALVRNEKCGFVFQFHYLLKEFTAQENIALPMFKLGRWSRAEAMDRAAGLLKQFNLGSKLRRLTAKSQRSSSKKLRGRANDD